MRDVLAPDVPASCRSIRVDAPARLHLGFLDPDGSRGRRFGSIGLALDDIVTVVRVEPRRELAIEGPAAELARVRDHVQTIAAAYGLPLHCAVSLDQMIPAHAGLGSGTQLALALGRALLAAHDRPFDLRGVATLLGRGKRSGIGLGVFASGGLVVDGGHGAAGGPPPVVTRLTLPATWRVVLVFDRDAAGLSGRAELAAFARLAPMPAAQAAHLCHTTLLGMLPAAVEGDFAAFSAAVGEVQAAVGDYFAPVQDGRYFSARVARAIEHVRTHCGLDGVGQSSWGPTAFAFCDSHARAEAVVDELSRACGADTALEFRIGAPRDHGARVVGEEQERPRRLANAGRA